VLGLQFVVAVWDPFAGRRFPLPAIVGHEKNFLSLVQPMGLFDVVYAIPRWSAPGRLADGTPVEVLGVAAPGARPREAANHFSRWNKFTFKEREHPFLFAELGSYLCRAYNERAPGPRLAAFRLIDDPQPPHDRGGRADPPTHREMWTQTCAEER
jgi:hypothetical protein